VVLDNADVLANTATDEGGGIYIVNGTLKLSNSSFVVKPRPAARVRRTAAASMQWKPGFYTDSTTAVMNNTATGNGGGLTW